jgi:hypothetical protein
VFFCSCRSRRPLSGSDPREVWVKPQKTGMTFFPFASREAQAPERRWYSGLFTARSAQCRCSSERSSWVPPGSLPGKAGRVLAWERQVCFELWMVRGPCFSRFCIAACSPTEPMLLLSDFLGPLGD